MIIVIISIVFIIIIITISIVIKYCCYYDHSCCAYRGQRTTDVVSSFCGRAGVFWDRPDLRRDAVGAGGKAAEDASPLHMGASQKRICLSQVYHPFALRRKMSNIWWGSVFVRRAHTVLFERKQEPAAFGEHWLSGDDFDTCYAYICLFRYMCFSYF